MKISDFKKAFDSVSANDELKEKVFSRLEAETEKETKIFPKEEMSYIELKKGGGKRFTTAAFCTAAAMVAVMFLISKAVFNVDVIDDPESTETSVVEEIPENTALVTLKVVDENGVPVKNQRVDYRPIIFTEKTDANNTGYTIDMENFDKGGIVPMTYGKDIELLIPYGDYLFYTSNQMANAEYDMSMMEIFNFSSLYVYGDGGGSMGPVSVDENTTEIVLTAYGGNEESSVYGGTYPKLGVILQDAQGNPLPGYTVILKPKSGVMQEGYTDEYGGYVLTITDETGEAFWRNMSFNGEDYSGEYEVIAYKEELHPASEPIREPFVFDGDNTISYTYKDTVFIQDKVFKMAE